MYSHLQLSGPVLVHSSQATWNIYTPTPQLKHYQPIKSVLKFHFLGKSVLIFPTAHMGNHPHPQSQTFTARVDSTCSEINTAMSQGWKVCSNAREAFGPWNSPPQIVIWKLVSKSSQAELLNSPGALAQHGQNISNVSSLFHRQSSGIEPAENKAISLSIFPLHLDPATYLGLYCFWKNKLNKISIPFSLSK